MKSEHRHELATNELADGIAHLPEFLRKNYMQIIGVVLIVLAFFLWKPIRGIWKKAEVRQQSEVTSLIDRITPSKMQTMQGLSQQVEMQNPLLVLAHSLDVAAKEASDPLHSAMALVNRGVVLRANLHYTAVDVDDEVLRSQIAQARQCYEQAIEKATGNGSLTAMAKYGLALCAEELSEFDKATEIYKEIAANADFEGTVFPAKALYRLEIMEDNRGKFFFAKVAENEIFTEGLPFNLNPSQQVAPDGGEIDPQTASPQEAGEIGTESGGGDSELSESSDE